MNPRITIITSLAVIVTALYGVAYIASLPRSWWTDPTVLVAAVSVVICSLLIYDAAQEL